MTQLTFPNTTVPSPGFGYAPTCVSFPRVGRLLMDSSAMSLSGIYGPLSDDEGVAVLKKAYELGSTFWDTASVYGVGHNEKLIGRFLKENPGAREKLFIGSKCGWEVGQ